MFKISLSLILEFVAYFIKTLFVSYFHLILDICKLSGQISQRDCCKTSAIVIFRHLIMFQYYHKWKKFDKSIKSLWVPPDEKKLKKGYLDYHFLAEWDEKSGKGLIQDWKWDEEKENCFSCDDFRCGRTTTEGILCRYKFVKLFLIHECGENVEIHNEVGWNVKRVYSLFCYHRF